MNPTFQPGPPGFQPGFQNIGVAPVVVSGGTGGGKGARRPRDLYGPLLLGLMRQHEEQMAAEAAAVAERDRLNRKERDALLASLRRQMAMQIQDEFDLLEVA